MISEGIFARMRYYFLKVEHPAIFAEMQNSGTLDSHLEEVENKAQALYKTLISDKQAGYSNCCDIEKEIINSVITSL